MYDECVTLSMRFPQKLWKIVNDCKNGAIKWSTNGATVLIDYKKFQDEYLDTNNPIFKTNNMTSFIRQLNLYGFRKVTSHNRDPLCNSNNPDTHEFVHENFRSARFDLLGRVCRKTAAGSNSRRQRAAYEHRRLEAGPKRSTTTTEIRRMTRLQVCQYTLTRELERATRDYHREMVARGRNDENAPPDSSPNQAVRAQRYPTFHPHHRS